MRHFLLASLCALTVTGCTVYDTYPRYYSRPAPPAAVFYGTPAYPPPAVIVRPYGYGYYYRPAPPPPPHWGPGPGWGPPGWGPRPGYGPPGWGPRYGPRW